MLSCPNTSSPEWIALSAAVGEYEAYRDYVQSETIRSVEEVQEKIRQENLPGTSSPKQYMSITELAESLNEYVEPLKGISAEALQNGRGLELANKLSKKLGIDYETITPEEAVDLTASAPNPWVGQAAFFYKGVVYFVKDRVSSNLVLHEFSHPFVRAIIADNPELFDNLFNKLLETDEGRLAQETVQKTHSDLEGLDLKEEVFVTVLANVAADQLQNLTSESGLAKVINNFLYAIKQLLRKLFGKTIQISKLNLNTSMDELASILTAGGQVSINTEVVSEADIVAYTAEAREEVSRDLMNVRNKDILDTVNTFYDVVSTQLNMLVKNEHYESLSKLLKKTGELQAIRANLGKWQTTIKEAAQELDSDIEESRSRVTALTNSLFRLEDVLEKVYLHTREISNYPDTQDNMHKAYYYDKLIKHWGKFIEQIEEALTNPENEVPTRSPITQLVGDVKSYIAKTKKLINQMYAAGARDALWDQLKPLNESIAEKYEARIQQAKDKKAPKRTLDNLYQEYHGMKEEEYATWTALLEKQKTDLLNETERNQLSFLADKARKGLSLSPEKIEQLLHGEIGDANWFNSYLEGYLYNTDPIVGGLSLFVKNALNEMMVISQQQFNSFATDIRENLKEAGYNPVKVGELGKDIGFKDKIGRLNPETGLLEEREVWTLLNQFKDYRYTISNYEYQIEQANNKWLLSQSDEDRLLWLKLKSEYDLFKREYMHQEYIDSFYERYELLEKDEVGLEARYRREEIFERMRQIQEPLKTQTDYLQVGSELDLLWREYKQLHSRYTLDGKLKTGIEEAVAKRLREFREISREFYEFKLRRNVFETAYFDYQQELRDAGVEEDSNEWKNRMQLWKDRNTRIVIKDEYYQRKAEILEQIKEILSKLPNDERLELDQTAVWEEILELTSGFRDDDGQPIATEMSEQSIARVKELEEKLEEIKKKMQRRSGLSGLEAEELSELYDDRDQGREVDQTRFRELLSKKRKYKLSSFDSRRLDLLYEELNEMSSRVVTDYYVEQLNSQLSKITGSLSLMDQVSMGVSTTTAKKIYDTGLAKTLMASNPEFKEWFLKNHVVKTKYDKESGLTIEKYKPLYVWMIVHPTDPDMYETYDVKDEKGKLIETVKGLPSSSYYSRVVKTKYRTRNVVGITKDNQGRFLPKTLSDGAKDDRFINKEYEKLKQENPEKFKLLEKLKTHHLKNQEQLPYNSRLYMDMPRYRKTNLEVIQSSKLGKSTKNKVNALTLFAKRAKDFIKGAEDDAEDGMNYKTGFNLVRADMFDDEMTGIPISGLYDIDIEDVSTDIIHGMMRYNMSGNRQKQLIKISPVVRAIQNTVNDPKNAIDDLNKVNRQEMKNRGLLRYLSKKDNVRQAAINNLIEREFDGQTQKGLGSDSAWLQNLSNLLFKRASFSFFALNIPSALKNSLGMKFQAMIEASGGEYIDHKSLQQGNIWSYKAMGELSFSGQLYTDAPKTHSLQLIEVFDMSQDRFENRFGESISRTMAQDVASFSWLYSPRKWVELQAGLQLSSALLYKKKIKQKLKDGTEKEISYIEAFEVIDGQLKLKEGIDARYSHKPIFHTVSPADTLESIASQYNIPLAEATTAFRGISIETLLKEIQDIELERQIELSEIDLDKSEDDQDHIKLLDRIDQINAKFNRRVEKKRLKIENSEFNFMKNRIHQVTNNMGGAYAKFDQPEAQRYLAFRFVSYMRRYFTTMAINRWGFSGSILDPKPRLNPGLGDVQMGFYIRFALFVKNTLQAGGKNLPYMTAEEKTAFFKFLTEVGMLVTTSVLLGLLFGWDPEDKDRFDKLRAKSGPTGMLGLTSESDRDFNLLGWLELHTIHLMMQVRAENEQFNLLTGGIKQYNSLLDIKSVAFGPTTDTYVQLWTDIQNTLTGDPAAYYTREIGPYKWQDQEGSKFVNHLAKLFGLTGTTLDPAVAIQNFQAFQAKVRR